MSSQRVIDALRGDGTVESAMLEGLSARVMVHNEGDDLMKAKLNGDAFFAFCTGPDWLLDCMAPGRTHRDWLLSLGFEAEWLDSKIQDGKRFTLLVFRPSAANGFAPTWENIFEKAMPVAFSGERHSELRARVLGHRAALESMKFAEIERLAVSEGVPHIRTGRDGHGHLTAGEYLAANDTLVNCRRFLRKEFQLTPLFGGCGVTVKEDGTDGFSEMMVLNCPVSDLPCLEMLPLSTKALLSPK